MNNESRLEESTRVHSVCLVHSRNGRSYLWGVLFAFPSEKFVFFDRLETGERYLATGVREKRVIRSRIAQYRFVDHLRKTVVAG